MSPVEAMWIFQSSAMRLITELGLDLHVTPETRARIDNGTASIEEILADPELQRVCVASFDARVRASNQSN